MNNQLQLKLIFLLRLFGVHFCQAGIDATAFHGEMRQGACPGALSDFKAGRGDVVVTTDLAVRGNGGVKGKRPSKKDK